MTQKAPSKGLRHLFPQLLGPRLQALVAQLPQAVQGLFGHPYCCRLGPYCPVSKNSSPPYFHTRMVAQILRFIVPFLPLFAAVYLSLSYNESITKGGEDPSWGSKVSAAGVLSFAFSISISHLWKKPVVSTLLSESPSSEGYLLIATLIAYIFALLAFVTLALMGRNDKI